MWSPARDEAVISTYILQHLICLPYNFHMKGQVAALIKMDKSLQWLWPAAEQIFLLELTGVGSTSGNYMYLLQEAHDMDWPTTGALPAAQNKKN